MGILCSPYNLSFFFRQHGCAILFFNFETKVASTLQRSFFSLVCLRANYQPSAPLSSTNEDILLGDNNTTTKIRTGMPVRAPLFFIIKRSGSKSYVAFTCCVFSLLQSEIASQSLTSTTLTQLKIMCRLVCRLSSGWLKFPRGPAPLAGVSPKWGCVLPTRIPLGGAGFPFFSLPTFPLTT